MLAAAQAGPPPGPSGAASLQPELSGMSPVQRAVSPVRSATIDRSDRNLAELGGLLALHATAESGAVFEDARAAARPLLASEQHALGYEAFIVTALSRLLTEGE